MDVLIIIFILPIVLLTEFAITSIAQSDNFIYDISCNNNSGNYTPNSLYQFSLYNLLGTFTSEASRTNYYKASYGQSPNEVYALYRCRSDLGSQTCSNCLQTAKNTILERCPYETRASIWYEECMIRYSNESFFSTMYHEYTPRVKLITNKRNVSADQLTRLVQVVRDTMNDLTVQAPNEGTKFGSKVVNLTGFSFRNLYTLAECVPDMTANDCNRCLKIAVQFLPVYSLGAAVFQPVCMLHYEIHPFFNQTANSTVSQVKHKKSHQHGKREHLVFGSITILVTITFLGVGIWICKGMRKQKSAGTSKLEMNKKRTVNSLQLDLDTIRTTTHNIRTTVDSLQFDLDTIRAATCNFSVDNKLGEGGFGEVYKGKLEDGREVAIKRLSKNSGQGIEEFKTEVDLVANLQHKNLVKLLGFCLLSTEKILVYEFMQNLSLDQILFDARKKVTLDWELRYKLIVGIARGLLYLHEDSRLKIIHRDLKPSNILLDEGMNPKISDFGLAKLFGVDETQGDTKRIVGTYGYMAPEYAMTGHFSVKSDVYSFGIIVLEIVSGQRNRFFGRPQIEEALLYRAWRLWNERKILQFVDTSLANKYPREEVAKCVHIALLCIQENATERPTMATIVTILNGQSNSLPMPKAPNYFGSSTTTEEIGSSHYEPLIVGTEIEYHRGLDQQDCSYLYSGTEMITNVYPR